MRKKSKVIRVWGEKGSTDCLFCQENQRYSEKNHIYRRFWAFFEYQFALLWFFFVSLLYYGLIYVFPQK